MPDEQGVKDWYNQFYAAKGVNTMRPSEAYALVFQDLNVEPGKRLLDIGCGTGYLLRRASELGLETFGLDISDEAVKIARTISPSSHIAVGKGESLEFSDDFFDYVTCLGSLEHFIDISSALQEMRRVAHDDGIFYIMVPNADYIYWTITGRAGTLQQDINENLFSLKQWKDLFTSNGFKILKVDRDRWFLKKTRVFSSANPLQIVKRFVYKTAWTIMPLRYTYQFIFIMRKG